MIELQPPTTTIGVPGGTLTVGLYNDGDHSGPPVLAIHGITATHRCWPLVASHLPYTRVIAPDLRGRGRSNQVDEPWGLRQHADDLATVLDALGVPSAHLVGHSMGAFVAVLAAARHPQRVLSVTLVDGGLPLVAPGPPPPGSTPVALGPAGDRLRMTFTNRDEYRQFWHRHPAFAAQWSETVQGYVDYDLQGADPSLRPSGVLAAVQADAAELFGPDWYLDALSAVDAPVTFLRAPRGLLNEAEGLYAPGRAESETRLRGVRVVEVADVNHYTIVLGEAGAGVVASEVQRTISGASIVTGGIA